MWHHIPGHDNPADCASRGLSPAALINHTLWWQGPPWLKLSSSAWPESLEHHQKLPEARVRVFHTGSTKLQREEPAELLRFSSLHRLLRVTAWCRRWRARIKIRHAPLDDSESLHQDFLSSAELEEARLSWIRLIQGIHFNSDISLLLQGRDLSRSRALCKYNPFMDNNRILRIGGRLRHALLSYDEKHPIILPSDSHFTMLIARSCHLRSLHGGVQLTLGRIRQHYWIPRGRLTVKGFIRHCVTCARWRAEIPAQLMGNLPKERVTPARPFLNTGVDYAGPIQLRTTKGRGHKSYKAYIAVFVCLTSRAVHLEAVSDYTTEAFLAAFRRFVARRGLCQLIFSDCGSNFVGADNQLRALFAKGSPTMKSIHDHMANNHIQWRFNPPAAPHFGGLWEAAVKAVKYHLRRVLGETTLTFEEMSTLLSEIEACLNSRPLQALNDDPEDLTALTPGHFLIGAPLTAIPEPSLLQSKMSQLTRWRLLQKLRDQVWTRWSQEYLHTLAHRPKWMKRTPDLCVGGLCLIRNETTPPTKWPLARIIRTHPGKDGVVRVVTVRTATTEYVRPIVKLVLLPSGDIHSPS